MLPANQRRYAPRENPAPSGHHRASPIQRPAADSAEPNNGVRPRRSASWMWRSARVLVVSAEVTACVLAIGIGVQLLGRLRVQDSWTLPDASTRFVEGSALAMLGRDAGSVLPALDGYIFSVPLVAWFIGLVFVLASLFVLRAMMCLIEQLEEP